MNLAFTAVYNIVGLTLAVLVSDPVTPNSARSNVRLLVMRESHLFEFDTCFWELAHVK